MNRFIVVEGLDGSGKSTQIELLQKFLEEKKAPFRRLHFPRSGHGCYGDLVARYLRGELGPLESVNPYLVSLLYAGDRNDAKPAIRRWLKEKKMVIVDRYVYSNIAFQCAKVDAASEKLALENWILHFEYLYNRIPRPDLSIYLRVPISFAGKKLAERRKADDRGYLEGKKDIHESSLALQKKVDAEYSRLSQKHDDFVTINCASDDGETIQSPEKIHSKIVSLL